MPVQIWGFANWCHVVKPFLHPATVFLMPFQEQFGYFIGRNSCLKLITAVSETLAVHYIILPEKQVTGVYKYGVTTVFLLVVCIWREALNC